MMLRIAGLSAVSSLLVHGSSVCNDPGDDPNAIRIDMDNGDVLYSCDPGYVTARDAQPDIKLTCGSDGLWGPVSPPSASPVCISQETSTQIQQTSEDSEETTTEVTCPDPGLVANAQRTFTHFAHGGEVFYTCATGYCATGHRTRTVILQCRQGKWNQEKPVCDECPMCSTPFMPPENHIFAVVNPDYTATLQCEDGYVIEPGTDIQDGTINCIEGAKWAEEIPVCSRPPQVVCGEDHMTVVIDKLMMTALGWSGGKQSLTLTGADNKDDQVLDPACHAIEDDAGENYIFSLQAPFTNKCRTKFEPVGEDYKFSNKVVWNTESGAIAKTSTLLDFDCIYQGIFVTSLQNPIKLAISTRTYRTSVGNAPFTVSMAIFHQRNYTGLVDNVPILHRGKRYFVELLLHEQQMGTPYLKKCYGSSSYLSEAELKKINSKGSKQSQIRDMIVDGCPAKRTLVRLENPPNHATRRYSFMFPKINVGIAELQFVYLHCEIDLKPKGFTNQCVRQNDYIQRRNRNPNDTQIQARGGRWRGQPGRRRLGERQYFFRDHNEDKLEEWEQKFQTKKNADNTDNFQILPNLMQPAGPPSKAQWDQAQGGRGRRSAIEESLEEVELDMVSLTGREDWPVSFGPVIVPKNETEISMAKVAESTLIQKLIPKKLVLDEMNKPISELEIMKEDEAVVKEEIEMEIETAESQKIVVMVSCIIAGCVLVFIVATYVGLKTDVCNFSDPEPVRKKRTVKAMPSKVEPVMAAPPKTMDQLGAEMRAEATASSCGTSMTADE